MPPSTPSPISSLASSIRDQLLPLSPDDTIHECGSASLEVLKDRPDAAKVLAHEKLHAFPFRHVPDCWRRLYEEASLWIAVKLLDTVMNSTNSIHLPEEISSRAVKRNNDGTVKTAEWKTPRAHADEATNVSALAEAIRELDMTLILTGAPGRRCLIHDIFARLEDYINSTAHAPSSFKVPDCFPHNPSPLGVDRTIPCRDSLSIFAFQRHLDSEAGPLIVRDVVNYWPASELWSNPQYLYRRTLHGQRLIPVELGRSYTDLDWSQKIMPFSEYLDNHLLNSNPTRMGYLAQHDLFDQIPALTRDTITPDLCYAGPPDTVPDNIPARQPEIDQPIRNAWLGPAGTVSPLHTDPYHNILCQVVGRKYIRLYSPSETSYLYPRGIDESGVSLENTSHVDISLVRKLYDSGKSQGASASDNGHPPVQDADMVALYNRFPLFKNAKYFECILEAGECLYIPVGWWHYIESLEVSFSVSYWFN